MITGRDSGIGRAVAIAYGGEGVDVLIAYLNEDSDAKEVAAYLEEAGGRCVLVPGDLSSPAHCRAVIDRTAEEFGGIDILVNNAGARPDPDAADPGDDATGEGRVVRPGHSAGQRRPAR